MTDRAYKTPVKDLLAAIPHDLVIQWQDKDGLKAWHNCPIGRIAQEAIAALEADMTQEPAAPGIYDVQSKAQREWWEVRNGLMTMVRFRSLKEIMAGLGIEQFKPFGDYPDYTTAPACKTCGSTKASITGFLESAEIADCPDCKPAETAADVEAWLAKWQFMESGIFKLFVSDVRDFIAARDKQHAEAIAQARADERAKVLNEVPVNAFSHLLECLERNRFAQMTHVLRAKVWIESALAAEARPTKPAQEKT